MSVALWVVDCALVIETVKVLYQFSSTAEVIEATWHWYVTIAKVTGGDSGLYSLLQHPTCPTVIDRKKHKEDSAVSQQGDIEVVRFLIFL